MKKFAALLLALVLGLSLSASALAADAQYANTKAFLELMDTYEITYTVEGIDDSTGDETVRLGNQGEEITYTFTIFFDEDNQEVSIRVWNILVYDREKLDRLLSAINELNAAYLYACWYADSSDDTVNIKMDMVVRENADVAEITLEALLHLADIIDAGYPSIKEFAK